MEVLAPLGIAIAVFASTNVDDLFLLAAYFADGELKPRNIVAGQFIGIGLLVLASAVAALGALTIPEGWIALLGLVPLGLGLHRLFARSREEARAEEEETKIPSNRSQVLGIAGVTAANGGDNLGVYIPLFARDIAAIPVYAVLFALMTAVWCWVGHRLVSHPRLGDRIRRYGHAVFPFVLIGLGLYILAGARALLR